MEQIRTLSNKQLDKFNFANLFNVVDLSDKSYYNISKTINFQNVLDIENGYVDYYQISVNDTWTSISYMYYGTIKLWWLICKFNNIIDPFAELIPGKKILIPCQQIINQILLLISNPQNI